MHKENMRIRIHAQDGQESIILERSGKIVLQSVKAEWARANVLSKSKFPCYLLWLRVISSNCESPASNFLLIKTLRRELMTKRLKNVGAVNGIPASASKWPMRSSDSPWIRAFIASEVLLRSLSVFWAKRRCSRECAPSQKAMLNLYLKFWFIFPQIQSKSNQRNLPRRRDMSSMFFILGRPANAD